MPLKPLIFILRELQIRLQLLNNSDLVSFTHFLLMVTSCKTIIHTTISILTLVYLRYRTFPSSVTCDILSGTATTTSFLLLPCPQPLATRHLFSTSIILSFQECYLIEIMSFVTFEIGFFTHLNSLVICPDCCVSQLFFPLLVSSSPSYNELFTC